MPGKHGRSWKRGDPRQAQAGLAPTGEPLDTDPGHSQPATYQHGYSGYPSHGGPGQYTPQTDSYTATQALGDTQTYYPSSDQLVNLHYPCTDYDEWMTAHGLQPQSGDEHSQAAVNALSGQQYGQDNPQTRYGTPYTDDPRAADNPPSQYQHGQVNPQPQYNTSDYTPYPPYYYASSSQPYGQHNSQNQNDTPYPEAPLTAADPCKGQQYGQDNGSQAYSQSDNYGNAQNSR